MTTVGVSAGIYSCLFAAAAPVTAPVIAPVIAPVAAPLIAAITAPVAAPLFGTYTVIVIGGLAFMAAKSYFGVPNDGVQEKWNGRKPCYKNAS